jgi:hypothetical protein
MIWRREEHMGISAIEIWKLMSPQERQEAMDENNRYFAWQSLGREGTWEENVTYYHHHAGPHVIIFEVEENGQEESQAA